MTTLRERIRAAELECARGCFPASAKVLEIGGGSGFQAKLLAEWGFEVASIDVAPEEQSCFPVQLYDGRTIPFAGATFDVVFSSNVLEHVEDVNALLEEATRVLKPGGLMVHILPSASWRWWTSAVHYIGIAKTGPQRPLTLRNLLRFGWALAFPHAHGAYANAFVELFTYTRARWKRVFERCGFEVRSIRTTGIFYTAYKLMAKTEVPRRRRLAKLLGSSCSVYVIAPRR